MKSRKTPGPSRLLSDILKAAGDLGVIAKVFRYVQDSEKISSEWGDSYTIPIDKGKEDALLCGKYQRMSYWNTV